MFEENIVTQSEADKIITPIKEALLGKPILDFKLGHYRRKGELYIFALKVFTVGAYAVSNLFGLSHHVPCDAKRLFV